MDVSHDCLMVGVVTWQSHNSFSPVVVRLDGSQPVRYGIKVEVDDKYRSLKQSLANLCGVPSSKLLLVEICGSVVRVRVEGVRSDLSLAMTMYCTISVILRASLLTAPRSVLCLVDGCMHMKLQALPRYLPQLALRALMRFTTNENSSS